MTLRGVVKRIGEAARPVTENPFRILGLSVDVSERDVEREGHRLLSVQAVGLGDSAWTSEQIRWAMAELRDPRKRAIHEFFHLSSEPPNDSASVAEWLAAVPVGVERPLQLIDVLSQSAGALVPEPSPLDLSSTPGLEDALRASLEPRRMTHTPVCIEALDLGLL